MADLSKILLPDGSEYNLKDRSGTLSDHLHDSTNLVPIDSKTYESTSYYATAANDWNKSSWFFLGVRPDTWYKPWTIKIKVYTTCNAAASYHSLTYCTLSGRQDGVIYANWNEQAGGAHYYIVSRRLKSAGYNAGYEHAIGVSILYGSNYTSSTYYRTFHVELLYAENCTASLKDDAVLWTAWPNNTSTNYNDLSSYDAYNRGLRESGDDNTVTENRISYFPGKTGAKGIWATGLFMEDANNTYQSICTAADGTVTSSNRTAGTTKIANTSGFKVGGTIWYTNTTYAANTNISGNAVIYSSISIFDSRYSLNTTLTAGSLTAYKNVYLVGTINANDGLFYLDQTWWTQTPTDTTKVYILIGGCFDSTTSNCRITLNEQNFWYRYDGAKLVDIFDTAATQSWMGLMSSADKTKLDNIASGAEVNQNAFSNVKVGSTTVSADSKTDTLELVGGSNITLTPDAANDKVTVALDDTVNIGSIQASEAQIGNVVVTGTSRFTNTINGTATYATNAGTANSANAVAWTNITGKPSTYTAGAGTATYDSAGQNINTTYIKNATTSGASTAPTTITFTKGNNSTFAVTTNNTTYANMGNASASAAGTAGLVPAPGSGQQNYVLTGSGWKEKAPKATNADTATYATNAGSANFSTNSSSATYATNAGTASKANSVPWSGITNPPSTFTPGDHTHTLADITDKGTAAAKNFTTAVTQNSGDLVTSGAVWTAIDNLPEPMVFRGSIGTGGTITSLPINGTGKIGDTYKVITDGTYTIKTGTTQAAKVGDLFICDSKTDTANTWTYIPSADEPSGTVTSITLKAGSGITLDVDNTAITTSGTRTISHADTSTQSSVNNSGRTYIQDITLDDYGHVTGIASATETVVNTDRYVNTATFADDSTNNANNPVKMTLTRAGSDTNTVTANIPKVSTATAGVVPKGAAVSAQSQSTKFLREDGTWAAPSYTVNTNTTYTISKDGESVKLTGSNGGTSSVSLSSLINGLGEGSSNATTNDYLVAQYAGGGTSTTSYHRRKITNVVNKTVVDSALGTGSDTTKFYRNDGTWAVPPNTTYSFTNGGTNSFTVTPSGGTAQTVTFTANDTTRVAKSGDTMTGNLVVPATRVANTYYGIVRGLTTQTPVETIIKTGIKWKSSAHMPVLHISGYAYGLNSPIEFKIGFYIYGGNIGWCGVTNMGAWKPTVYLFKYTRSDVEYVAVGLAGTCYYLQLQVDVQDEMGTFANIVTTSANWSVTFSTSTGNIPTPDSGATCIQVPYKADILKDTTYTLEADTTNNKIVLKANGTAQNNVTVPYATNAGTATNDSNGNNISTYIKNVTTSGGGTSLTTFTFTRGNGGTFAVTAANTTYANMGNASASTDGSAGLVPKPTSGQQDYVLTGSGWKQKAPKATNADTATYATNAGTANYSTYDSGGSNIRNTYIKNVTTTSVANGTSFTFTKGNGDTFSVVAANNDTWRNIKVNGTELLSTATSSGAANLKNGTNITITGSGNDVTVSLDDTINIGSVQASEAQIGNVVVTGTSRFTNVINGTAAYASSAGAVAWANVSGKPSTFTAGAGTATYDTSGNNLTTYIKNASTSGTGAVPTTITFTKGTGATFAIVTNNTTYGNMGTASASAGGSAGLVPAPSQGQQNYVLTGGGWSNTASVAYATSAGTASSVPWSGVTNPPSTYAPGSHTHGNIQNGGTLQTNDVGIASGDKLVITDSSDSNKVARSTVTFDGSTTNKCLTPKGTWESFTNNSGTITKVQTTAGTHSTISVTSGAASFNVPTKTSHLTNDSGFVTTDTKNTAGSTDTSSKIYLVGATTQTASTQTYSDNEVYTTSGVLTTKSVQVGGGSAAMQYNSTTKSIDFVFA